MLAAEGAQPAISVVVATKNRARLVRRLLQSLAQQTISDPFEVVLIDDGSTDETSAVADSMRPELPFDLQLLRMPQSVGPGAARNKGWRSSRSQLVAFTDDDCVPDPGWLAEIRRSLSDVDIVVGRTKPPEDQLSLIGPFSSYLDLGHNGSFSTCNIGYRRSILEATEGFDPDFRWPNGEDTDLGLRARKAGATEHFAEHALVWHDVHPSTFKSHVRRLRRLDGLVALVSRHPEVRDELFGGSLFLRSVDKAVILVFGSAIAAILIRRRPVSVGLLAVSVAAYGWQFRKAYYPSRSTRELIATFPRAFVADTFALSVLARSSIRWRTILL